MLIIDKLYKGLGDDDKTTNKNTDNKEFKSKKQMTHDNWLVVWLINKPCIKVLLDYKVALWCNWETKQYLVK